MLRKASLFGSPESFFKLNPLEGLEEDKEVITSTNEKIRRQKRYKRAQSESQKEFNDDLLNVDSLRVLSNPSYKHLMNLNNRQSTPIQMSAYKLFRSMAPYIAVIHVPGEVLESDLEDSILHDIALLKTLGVKIVLVAGCRPQTRRHLEKNGIASNFQAGNRVCDKGTLEYTQQVAGFVRVQIESKLGRGLLNAPSGVDTTFGSNNNEQPKIISGNFVKAIPYGVRDGVDYKYTGLVQRINARKIISLLEQGDIVLLSHLGYSQSGQVFHCRSEEVAVKAAIELKADKLIFFHNGETLVDSSRHTNLVHNLSLKKAVELSSRLKEELGQDGDRIYHEHSSEASLEWRLQFLDYLLGAIAAVRQNVSRVHLVSRHIEGSLITELCTRDGLGLLISKELYDGVRRATLDDIAPIQTLIKPLEEKKILVTRPPELLELEIAHFYVYERDGEVLACFHYKNYEDPRYKGGASEMSCVAVSQQLRQEGLGNALLSYCLRKALVEGCENLFVLSTQSSHWFVDRGFEERLPESLPKEKYQIYNFNRNPKVYFKKVVSESELDQEAVIWSKGTNLSLYRP
eukprot:maker-scaffold_1-augustus-gene-25.17-mRNA-1 protein AED:0.07 eAED:0.08 QI:0/0/0/1/0/0.5/2/0/572